MIPPDDANGMANSADPDQTAHRSCDRDVWRSNVRSAMHAASQLPRGELTDVDNAPAPRR